MGDRILNRWDNRPFLIAGPCSAESETQMLEIAKGVKKSGADLLRAGVWKPRTRPGSFEGHGEQALDWVVKAGKETGIPTCIEVASPLHVELALKAGVDVLWIGARTTVNPFMVQELADSLRGSQVPVMVKNPVNPDLGLWIGALERLEQAGISELAAIHRGFSTYEKTPFRNSPNWNIAIELRTMSGDLPIYCDPSHICGNREMLAGVSQRAIDLDMDGLMIESHIDPDNALSDADQQITPDQLSTLINSLTWRNPDATDVVIASKLEELRAVIDSLDHQILDQMAKRMRLSQEIGVHKRQNDITVFQPERWKEIIADRIAYGTGKNISEEFIQALLKTIHDESIKLQTEIMNEPTKKEKL
jgi:chorismate mutase